MAQHAHYPGLVYQHNTGPQPPILSGSGTTSLSSNPHDMSWNGGDNNSPPSSTSSSGQSPSVYSLMHRSAEHEYMPQQSSSAPMSRHAFPSRLHSAPYDSRQSHEGDLGSHQEAGNIGPDRGIARRRSARQEQTESSVAGYSRPHPLSYASPFHQASRPQSPMTSSQVAPYYSDVQGQQGNGMAVHHATPHHHSSSAYSQYPFAPSHSRSTSGSASTSNPRSASPALSNASALTSVSSHTSIPQTHALPLPVTTTMTANVAPRVKNKKQRLYNVDRKKICLFQKEHPHLRQEEIAKQFNVERSTVSKILKQKAKWMNVPDEDTILIAKHRPSKFPFLERCMQEWVMECTDTNIVMTDAMIRNKARDIAKGLRWPEDKFKASSGWVENFKHRHGIKKGVWHGKGKNTLAARATGCGVPFPEEEYENMDSSVDHLPPLPSLPDYGNSPRAITPPLPMEHAMTADSDDDVANQLYHVRRHPVWQSPEQSGDGGHHHLSSHHAMQSQDDMAMPPPDPHRPPLMATPAAVAVPIPRAANGDADGEPEVAFVVPELPTYRPVIVGVPSVPEAEDAIDRVIAFVTAQEDDFLNHEERNAIHRVKCALFQLGSGVPYNRD